MIGRVTARWRSAFGVLLVASLAGCELGPAAPPEAPETTFVAEPSVSFDAQGEPLVAYRQTLSRGETLNGIGGTPNQIKQLKVGTATLEMGRPGLEPPATAHAAATSASGVTVAAFLTGNIPLDPLRDPNTSRLGFVGCRSTPATPEFQCHRPNVASSRDRDVVLAVNGNGASLALLVTTGREDSASQAQPPELYALHLNAAGNWLMPRFIADLGFGSLSGVSRPVVFLDNDANGHLLYFRADGRLVTQRYLGAFDQWQAPLTLSDASDLPIEPSMNERLVGHPAAPATTTLAMYQRSDQPIRSFSWTGSSWQSTSDIPSAPCWGPFEAAMNAAGDAVIAWACNGAIYSTRYTRGAWEAPVAIGTLSGRSRPRIAVDAAGNAVAVWRDDKQLMNAGYVAGRGWQAPAAVGVVTDGSTAEDFAVAMHDSGRAVAAWVRNIGVEVREGTRLATAEVGPFALQLNAPRHAFGGDALRLTLKLAVTPTQPVTISLSTTLPAGSLTLPSSVAIAANQSEVSLDVPTRAVNAFTDGDIVATYSGVRSAATVTLMPEPTSLTLTPSPARVIGGATATLDIVATPGYAASVPIVASLTSDNPTAQVPAQVALGSTGLAQVTIVTSSAASEQSAVLTARVRGLTATTTLQIAPTSLAQATLTVAVAGGGSVTSAPAGINCGSDCSETYPLGTRVTLNPPPAAGQRFYAWSGDADCSDGVLTMSAARACTAVFLPALPPYPEGLGWVVLGAPLTLASEVDPTPSLARDTNHPVVAYVEALGGDVARLFVKRLEGASFVTLGSGALNAGSITAASEPSLVTTVNGQPFVAWIQGNGIQQNVFVARFNGTAWESVGPPGIPLNYVAGSTASRPALALDAENQPLVAWLENGVVKLKRFDGAAWVAAAGGEGPAGATGDQLRLSTDLDGVPVLAWRQPGGGGALLKVVRGLMFEPLGPSINAPGTPMTFFDVKAEVGGATAVLSEAVTPVTVRRQRWDGSAWVFVAGPIVSNDPRPLESLVLTRGFQSEVVLSLANANDNSAVMSAPGLTSLFGTSYAQRLRNLSAVMVRADSPIVAATQSPTSGRYEARVWRFYP